MSARRNTDAIPRAGAHLPHPTRGPDECLCGGDAAIRVQRGRDCIDFCRPCALALVASVAAVFAEEVRS